MFVGTHFSLPLPQLKELVVSGGGRVVSKSRLGAVLLCVGTFDKVTFPTVGTETSDSRKRTILVLDGPRSRREIKKLSTSHNAPLVGASWILDSISTCTLQPVDNYTF